MIMKLTEESSTLEEMAGKMHINIMIRRERTVPIPTHVAV